MKAFVFLALWAHFSAWSAPSEIRELKSPVCAGFLESALTKSVPLSLQLLNADENSSRSIDQLKIVQTPYDFEVHSFRGELSGGGLPSNWTNQSFVPYWQRIKANTLSLATKDQVLNGRESSLQITYKSYGQQGKERNEFLDVFKSEDQNAAERTMQFLFYSKGEVIARVQAQFSHGRDQPVNSERHFQEASAFLRKDSGSILGEVGRLSVFKPNDVDLEFNKQLLARASDRARVFTLLMERLTASLDGLDPALVVVLQTNSAVLRVLQQSLGAGSLAHKIQVQMRPDLPKEWLIKLDQVQVARLHRAMFSKRFEDALKTFLEGSASEMSLSVEPDEVKFLESYDAYKLSRQYTVRMNNEQVANALGLSPIDLWSGNPFFESQEQMIVQGSHTIRFGRAEAELILKAMTDK